MMLKYNEPGDLVFVELRDFDLQLTGPQREWLWAFIPKTIDELNDRKAKSKLLCTITPVDTDLSFAAFWDLYDYKLGNKIRAEKHWNALDDATRALAMKKVKEYNYWQAHQTSSKVFAERWLAQKRYENEYRV